MANLKKEERVLNHLVDKIHLAARRGVLNKEAGSVTKKTIKRYLQELEAPADDEKLKKEIKSLQASKAALTKSNDDLKKKVEKLEAEKKAEKDAAKG